MVTTRPRPAVTVYGNYSLVPIHTIVEVMIDQNALNFEHYTYTSLELIPSVTRDLGIQLSKRPSAK